MPTRKLIVALPALLLCCASFATAQTDVAGGLPLERFEAELEAEEDMLLANMGGRGGSSSSQVAGGKDVTAYQLIASREELSYLKLAIDATGLQGTFNATERSLATYLLPSNDAFRSLLLAVNSGRQEPRGVNQSEFYLLRSLTRDPIVAFILVFNVFPSRRWTTSNMRAGQAMISQYNNFLVNIVEDVGAADDAKQNGEPPIMLETENSTAPPARIVEYDIDLLGPSVAHVTDMVLLPPFIAEDPPAPTSSPAPGNSQAGANSTPPCDDQPPSPEFTCVQQKAWGKCLAIWMVQGNFCRATCGACTDAAPEAGAQPVTVTDVGPTNATTVDSESPSLRKLLVGGASVSSRPSVTQQEKGDQNEQPHPAGQLGVSDQGKAVTKRSLQLLRSRFSGALNGLRGAQRTPHRGQMQQQQQQQQRAKVAKPRL